MKRHALHPACRLFPPLGKEELSQLADDIRAQRAVARHRPLPGQDS